MHSIFTPNTQRNILANTAKPTRDISHDHDSQHTSNIQNETHNKLTFIDASTREKLPEASPKGSGSKHFKALAGQRSRNTKRVLVTQGLASGPPKPENKTPHPKKKHNKNTIDYTSPSNL